MPIGRKPSFQPTLECLEERDLLATHLTATLSVGLLQINGTTGADTIVVREVNNRISVDGVRISVAGQGNESSVAAASVKQIAIHGNGGNDRIFLNSQATRGQQALMMPATVWGGNGNDLIVGGAGPETLYGGGGNDTLYAGSGNDLLYGGDGNDVLVGGRGSDKLYGEGGNDKLYAGSGNTQLDGGPGANTLVGGAGSDVFVSHSPQDVIQRGSGKTTIDRIYSTAAPTVAASSVQALSFSAPQPSAAPATPFQAQVNQVVALENAYRASLGLSPLTVSSKLTAAAQSQATTMAQTGAYSHTDPDGRTLSDRVEAAGYSYSWVGENILLYDPAIGRTAGVNQFFPPSQLPQYFFDGWKASAEHNAILTSPQAEQIGVALAQAPNGLIYADMVLGRS